MLLIFQALNKSFLFPIILFRSTEEIFALFISLAFTVDAVSSIVKGKFLFGFLLNRQGLFIKRQVV